MTQPTLLDLTIQLDRCVNALELLARDYEFDFNADRYKEKLRDVEDRIIPLTNELTIWLLRK